jgi:hypothetical protein
VRLDGTHNSIKEEWGLPLSWKAGDLIRFRRIQKNDENQVFSSQA